MHLLRYPFLVLAASLFLNPSLAAAQRSDPPESLKKLDWLIGNWTWHWNTDQDVPGIAGKGDEISGEMLCKWNVEGHAIDMRLNLTVAGQNMWSAHTLIGWDPVAKRLITRSFDSNGGHGSGTFQQQPDGWLLRTAGVNAQGEELVNAMLFTDIHPERFSLQGTNREAGRDEVAFGPKTKFERKKKTEN